jgi:hypothetical protein
VVHGLTAGLAVEKVTGEGGKDEPQTGIGRVEKAEMGA